MKRWIVSQGSAGLRPAALIVLAIAVGVGGGLWVTADEAAPRLGHVEDVVATATPLVVEPVAGLEAESSVPSFSSSPEKSEGAPSLDGARPSVPSSEPVTASSGTGTGTGTGTGAGAGTGAGGRGSRLDARGRVVGTGEGGSRFYDGASFFHLVPVGFETKERDQKAAQLERSADVAKKRGTIVGRVERVTETEIGGWAYAWDDSGPVQVEVFLDGKLLGAASSTERRASFAGDPLNPIAERAWRLALPDLKDDRHVLVALASRAGDPSRTELEGSPWALGGDSWPSADIALATSQVVAGSSREGWTISILVDGKLVTRVAASRDAQVKERAVAKAPGLAGADAVFLYEPQAPLEGATLQVKVASEKLERDAHGSPVNLRGDNALPYGAVNFISEVQISGWCVDPDSLPGPIDVDVVIDGVPAGRIPADKTFAALPNFTGLKEAEHAFTFVPPDKYRDGKTHTIQFFAVNKPEGVNPELQGSPAYFVGKRNAAPYGWLDAADANIIAGWTYDPDAGSAAIDVEIWIDGELWKRAPANVTRPDLVPIVAAEAEHGFSWPSPEKLKDGKHHTIRAFGVNVPDGPRSELSGSPKELNAQQPLFGLRLADSPAGLRVDHVLPGSAAETAGIKAADVIKAFDGREQNVDLAAFVAWAGTKEVGEQVVFKLAHEGEVDRSVTVTTGTR